MLVCKGDVWTWLSTYRRGLLAGIGVACEVPLPAWQRVCMHKPEHMPLM